MKREIRDAVKLPSQTVFLPMGNRETLLPLAYRLRQAERRKVRRFGHPAGAWRELQLLIDRWNALGTKLIPVDFTFPLNDAPLSSHLRDCDKQKLKDGWDQLPHRQEKLAAIDNFLAGNSPIN